MALFELKDLVPGMVQKIGITDKSYQIMTLIEREIQNIAPFATIAGNKNGKIYIEVDSSVQLFELNFRKREILKCLDFAGNIEKPELKFFLKGTAKPTAQDRLRSTSKNFPERN